jgi:hypothetical protein
MMLLASIQTLILPDPQQNTRTVMIRIIMTVLM